jgi:hypothetical protein
MPRRLLQATMNERARRLWAGAEAGAIGYGGVVAVARATGVAISTVRKGGMRFAQGPRSRTSSTFDAALGLGRTTR